MTLNLDTLFFEDYFGASWEVDEGEIRQITWSTEDYSLRLPGGNYEGVTESLDNYIHIIRRAFNIWDKAIESIKFVETNLGNSANVTVAATSIDGNSGTLAYWNYLIVGNNYINEATIRFDDSDLNSGMLVTTAMHEIGNILGLGDLRSSTEYMSVQEDPILHKFDANELWDFDKQMIDLVYPGSVKKSVYRFYNSEKGTHFFTASESEKDNIISKPEWGYAYEGVAYKTAYTETTKLYRFFNREKGYHFMTASKKEADYITGKPEWGYEYEGRSFKVSTRKTENAQSEVHRFYHPERGVHFYTADETEAENVIAKSLGYGYSLDNAQGEHDLLDNGWGYRYEGVAWYASDV